MSARLMEALERIVVATPNNTNSATAAEMASWTQAVALCALDDHREALRAAHNSSALLIDAVRAHRAQFRTGLKEALAAVRDGWRPA